MTEQFDIFLCDIRGTYTSQNESNTDERKKTVINFINSLEKIIQKDQCENMFFCFASTDSNKNNEKYINEFTELLKYTNSNIIYFDYCKDKNIEIEKLTKINSILKNEKIRNLYLADNTPFYHDIVDHLINKKYTKIKKVSFKIKNNLGIEELTKMINNYCLSKRINNQKEKSTLMK